MGKGQRTGQTIEQITGHRAGWRIGHGIGQRTRMRSSGQRTGHNKIEDRNDRTATVYMIGQDRLQDRTDEYTEDRNRRGLGI